MPRLKITRFNEGQINERMKITLENDAVIPDELPSEFTIVRIWTSGYNTDRMYNTQYVFCCVGRSISSSVPARGTQTQAIDEEGSKGHVSMELILNRKRGTKSNSTYLSFGPKDDYPENSLETHEGKYIENYSKDLEYMERKPNFTIILYSLDVLKMKIALQQLIKVEKQKWTLTGPRCNMGSTSDSFSTKTLKRIRFVWWATVECAATFAKLPFHRTIITTESEDTLVDPTAKLSPDENGEITMNCVSSVFYILHQGKFTNLLPRKDQRRIIGEEVSAVGSQSIKDILEVNLEKVLRNSGYIFHLSISSVVINPDAFLCIIKYAKRRELKIKNFTSTPEIQFRNDNIMLKTPPEEMNELADEIIKSTNGYKQTVALSEWIPKINRQFRLIQRSDL